MEIQVIISEAALRNYHDDSRLSLPDHEVLTKWSDSFFYLFIFFQYNGSKLEVEWFDHNLNLYLSPFSIFRPSLPSSLQSFPILLPLLLPLVIPFFLPPSFPLLLPSFLLSFLLSFLPIFLQQWGARKNRFLEILIGEMKNVENHIQLHPAIPEVKGPTNFICYWRIFVITNMGNKEKWFEGTIVWRLLLADFRYPWVRNSGIQLYKVNLYGIWNNDMEKILIKARSDKEGHQHKNTERA